MKLKAVHCYQYVTFQKKNENFLTAKDGMKDLELELIGNLVSVKSGSDHILVGLTNIAYMIPMTPETVKKDLGKRGNIGDMTPSSPVKA